MTALRWRLSQGIGLASVWLMRLAMRVAPDRRSTAE
jgi:hypothetical protein